jgi:hypothetical protein
MHDPAPRDKDTTGAMSPPSPGGSDPVVSSAQAVLAPHARPQCDSDRYPCACDGKQYTLDDVASLVAEWPRPAQRRVLEFALALPPELVSAFWRVVWTADAARGDTEREEDALSALHAQIAARARCPMPEPLPRRAAGTPIVKGERP